MYYIFRMKLRVAVHYCAFKSVGPDGGLSAVHNQLHNWLLPYIDVLATLQQARTNQEQRTAVKRLMLAKELFEQHFE